MEVHQEGAVKGYNPKKPGNNCYNIQFAFCDELKAYINGFVRSGNTYNANGAAEMIKGKEYPTMVAQVTDPSVVFVTGEEGWETTKLTTALNMWK